MPSCSLALVASQSHQRSTVCWEPASCAHARGRCAVLTGVVVDTLHCHPGNSFIVQGERGNEYVAFVTFFSSEVFKLKTSRSSGTPSLAAIHRPIITELEPAGDRPEHTGPSCHLHSAFEDRKNLSNWRKPSNWSSIRKALCLNPRWKR